MQLVLLGQPEEQKGNEQSDNRAYQPESPGTEAEEEAGAVNEKNEGWFVVEKIAIGHLAFQDGHAGILKELHVVEGPAERWAELQAK